MADDLLKQADSHADYSRLNFSGSWRETTAAVVGLGALGSELVRLLGGMGMARVLLIDPDCLEPANLPYSVLFRIAFAPGLARPALLHSEAAGKAETLARVCLEVFPDTRWEPFADEIADVPLERLAACDLIFSATDNALARAETSLTARLLGKPMIDGGLKTASAPWPAAGAPEGRVSSFHPAPAAACYLCRLSEKRRAELLRWAIAPTLGCAAEPEAAAMRGTPALASVVAGTMIQIAAAFTMASPGPGTSTDAQPCSRSWICRLPPSSQQPVEVELSRSADCPWHRFEAGFPGLQSIDAHTPLATALRTVSAARGDGRPTVLELLWPLCLEARCAACGTRTQPLQRVARIRLSGRCPGCGAVGTSEPLAAVASIAEHDPLAARSLAQLGLPDRRLFWCRAEYSDTADQPPDKQRTDKSL